MAQDRDIKYINRDFGDFRAQLIEYAKNYFPETYNDFSPTSPGMMFMEMAAYVGDILSFYQDTQLQETYLQYAKEPGNLYALAYMMGYSPKVTSVSEVELEVSHTVAATAGSAPDMSQALLIAANAQLTSTTQGQVKFFIDREIDFAFESSTDPTEVTVASTVGGSPASFQLKKKVKAFSGEVITVQQTFNSVEKFATFNIEDDNIVGILDIVDSNGNIWTEVPFLAQDTVFNKTVNTGADAATVPYILTLQKVNRRFVTRFNSQGTLTVQFGAGITGRDPETFVVDPKHVGSNTPQGISRLDYAYDPSNFLFSKSYGLAPSNTILTVRYIKGGGIQANVPANTITEQTAVVSTGTGTGLTFNNPQPAAGGRGGDSIEELRQNSLRAFNEQKRAVTKEDYAIRALSLPSTYGNVAKVYVTQDQLRSKNSTTDNVIDSNPLALSMYVAAYDQDGKLINATNGLKQNLRTYLSQYRLITDALNIKDAFVVNIGVKFDIITLPGYSGRDVLLACSEKLRSHFEIAKWNINQPINLSSIYTLLDQVKGVQTVQKIEVENLSGGNYSEYEYDVKGATRNNIVYPSYDPCIFEVKFPDTDIKGRITTL